MAEIARCLREDALAYMRHSADFALERQGILRLASVLLTPPLLCSLLHRVAYALWSRRLRAAARAVARANFRIHKAWIAPDAAIGPGLYIPHTAGVLFDGRAGSGLTLFANALVGRGAADHRAPRLGDDVTVGAFAIVTGGVSIGDGARIGPGCVVGHDVPARCVTVAPRLTTERETGATP
jgi:serine acetyltransferase